MKLKILITVDPEIPVPPLHYGGIERIVDGLIKDYNQLGHEILLLANPKSTSEEAHEIIGWKGNSSENKLDTISNSLQLLKIVLKYKPNIIHSFSRLLYLWPVFLFTKSRAIMTYQRSISNTTTYFTSKIAGNKLMFSACGAHLYKNLRVKEKFRAIYNFTDINYFTDDEFISKEYLMFLGRIQDIKGTKEAIDVALAAGEKLIIAGNIHPGHEEYFDEFIQPQLNNPLVEYVGPVDDQKKKYYLQRSKAFLFPIKWPEPFGIVMAEAMACGTPVIGFNQGSVPEVIKDGETGFIVNSIDEMIAAVSKVEQLDRKKVRSYCVANFSSSVIASQYLNLYNEILGAR